MQAAETLTNPYRPRLLNIEAMGDETPDVRTLAMAFADPERVKTILECANFFNVEMTELQTKIPIEADVPASVEKLLAVGPVSRLIGNAPPDLMQRIRAQLHDAISEYHTERGVMMGSTTWIVSATPS